MRTCLGCRRKTNKSDLIRIVRSPDGRVHADPLAKAPGRGAYLCRDAECLKRVRKSGALARSLKVQIPEEVYEDIGERIAGREEDTQVSGTGSPGQASRERGAGGR